MSIDLRTKTTLLMASAVAGLAAVLPGGTRGEEPAAHHAALAPLVPPPKAGADAADPNIGLYLPDKRLVGLLKIGDEMDALTKERAKASAKSQTAASIEASLKRFTESTDEKAERQALADIETAMRRYENAAWLIDQLWIEQKSIPYPAEKESGEKKR
jgi:hypothetical protein